jgi:methyl acetate hydrolase
MAGDLRSSIDAILRKVTSGSPRVAGVVAIATERNGNIYEGAAGKRLLGGDADMTVDTVFAIFSTARRSPGPQRCS